jgi:archaellum biogenesis ATPase FlaH
MPRIIDLKEAKKGTSEDLVLQQFKTKISQRNWVIVHSLASRYGSDNVESELDFLVLIPNKGLILIEVKGADGFHVDERGWRLKGLKKGQENKDPFKQIHSAEWPIRSAIKLLEINDYTIPIARLVWFPKINEDKASIEASSTGLGFKEFEIKYEKDLRNVEKVLLNHIDHHLALRKTSSNVHEDAANVTEEFIEALVSKLVPDFGVPVSTEQLMRIRSKLVRKAEEEHSKVLDLVSSNTNLYFTGPAGSGKSQLLAKLAIDCAKQGHSVLLTCHQVMMAESLSQRIGPNPNIKVANLADVMLEVSGKSKHKETNLNKWYEIELPTLALRALSDKTARPHYSVVIVDEFQDIASNGLKVYFIKGIQNKISHRQSRFIFAADDLQQVLNDNEAVDSFESARAIAPNLTHVKLSQNCRQMPNLAREVYKFLGRPYPFADERVIGDLDSGLEVISCDENNQARKLKIVLERLAEEYPKSNIRILCFDNNKSLLGRLFQKVEIKDSNEKALLALCKEKIRNPNGPIKWRSIRKFKGLDEDAIVIIDVSKESEEFVKAEIGKNLLDMLYVGMTRARFKVVLLVQDGLFSPTHNVDGSKFI